MTRKDEDTNLDHLVEQYFDMRRHGTAPGIDEYVKAHPDAAAELRELLQAMEILEGGPEDPSTSDPDFVAVLLSRLRAQVSRKGYAQEYEIARGGQGIVFSVWDNDLRRRLAMKVAHNPTEGAGADPRAPQVSSLGRFLEEAQVTAQLDHPGIAPVHELGLDSGGRVYFTMKLVQGMDLGEVFASLDDPGGRWNRARVLGVFLKVCEAMAYAHSRGVVHRDLKPQNIMVGRYGEVYVMDWGLARVLGRPDNKDVRIRSEEAESVVKSNRDQAAQGRDSPLVTMDGDVVGTPAYMPPEQARGELASIGPRSDVYALGAMLYHLLTGRMPYVKPGVQRTSREIWQLVQKGPPASVVSQTDDAPEELVAICERAMARRREERYANVSELAEDLRAFLEHRVVQAYRTGAWTELRKWVERNKALASASAAAILLALGGFASVGYVEARGRILAEEQRDYAEAIQEFMTERVLGGSFRMGESGRGVGSVLFVDVLDEARQKLEEATEADGLFERMPRAEAAACESLGWSYAQLGHMTEGIELMERSLFLRREELGDEHAETLESQRLLGMMLVQVGDPLGRGHLEHVIKTGRSVFGETSKEIISSRSFLANDSMQRGELDIAQRIYEETLALLREGSELGSTWIVGTITNLGLVAQRRNDNVSAERHYREALLAAQDLLGPDDLNTLYQHATLGQLLARTPFKAEEAEQHLTKALDGYLDKFGIAHWDTHYAAKHMVEYLLANGRRDEALSTLETVMVGNRVIWNDDPAHLGPIELALLQLLSETYGQENQLEKSREAAARRIQALEARASGRESSPASKNECAWTLLISPFESLRAPSRALALALQACEMTSYENADFLDTLALACHETGDAEAAIEYQSKALGLLSLDAPQRAEFESRMAQYGRVGD